MTIPHTDLIKLGLGVLLDQIPASAVSEPVRELVEVAAVEAFRAILKAIEYDKVVVEVPAGVQATGLLDLGRRVGQVGQ